MKRGWCEKHYQRWRKHGDTSTVRYWRRPPTVFAGETYGRLTVIKEMGPQNGRHDRTYLCRCECGGDTRVPGYALKNGNTKSCGCLKREKVPHDFNVTHGHSRQGKTTPTYNTWKAMNDRVFQPNCRGYEWYGGRGISIVETWRRPHGFPQFLADMGERPAWATGGLDRIDPDGDYEPRNCRWTTKEQQAQNKRPSARLSKVARLREVIEAQRDEIERLKSHFLDESQ